MKYLTKTNLYLDQGLLDRTGLYIQSVITNNDKIDWWNCISENNSPLSLYLFRFLLLLEYLLHFVPFLDPILIRRCKFLIVLPTTTSPDLVSLTPLSYCSV